MRRWFVLTLLSGVLVTLAGCGGEVATETADSSGSAAPAVSGPPSTTPASGGAPTGASTGGGGRNKIQLPGDPIAASMGNGGEQQGGPTGGQNPAGANGQNPYGPNGGGYPGGDPLSSGGGNNQNPYAGVDPANPMGYPGGGDPNAAGGNSGNPNPYAGGGDPANPMSYPGGGDPNAAGGNNGNPNPYAGGGDPANPMSYPGGGNPYGPGGPGVDPANPMGGGVPAGAGSGGDQGQGAVNVSVPGSQLGGGNGGGQGSGAVNVSVPGSQLGGGNGAPTGPPAGAGYPGGGYPGAPGARPQAAPEPKTLKEKAEYAFKQGRDDEGFQYMYAYMIADPEAEFDFGLLPVINKPRAAVRWGVAIDYKAPGNFTKAPPTIGAKPNVLPQARGQGRPGFGAGGQPSVGEPSAGGGPSGFGAGGGNAGGPPQGGSAQLTYYTGELGQKVVERLNMRRTHADAFYGSFLKDIAFDYNPAPPQSGFGSPMGGAGFNPMGAGVGSGGGDFSGPSSGPGGYPYGQPGGAPAGPQRDANTDQLIPGVVWMGKGNRTQMVEAARERGLDALILIETKIAVVAKTGLESNITKLVVLNVNATETKEQIVYQTRSSLKNVPVWQAREAGKEDPIEIELDKMFPDTADKELKLGELPTLTPEQAKGRVNKIAASNPENALPVLAEIKYFHNESLINDADLMSAYEQILGDADAAKSLASGSGEDREKAIDEWMPGNFDFGGGGGGGGGTFR